MENHQSEIRALRRLVYRYFKHNGRSFPWRSTKNPYRILVSEVMLQQTQAGARTVEKFNAFIRHFPTVEALAFASLKEVYLLWQGLGYNRRAKALRDAALVIVEKYKGRVPSDRETLEALPGVGPYTAGAILVFAFNKPEALIETNIRTVFIHHFFPRSKSVHDKKLLPLIASTLDRKDPRKWYSALMDYGTFLKKEEGNVSRRSRHYVRQSSFKGSAREVRGKILKVLAVKPTSIDGLRKLVGVSTLRLKEQLQSLIREGMVVTKRGRFELP